MKNELSFEQAARQVSSSLHEPDWLLKKRLEAVALLEKRKGRGEVEDFNPKAGRLKLKAKVEGNATVLPIAKALEKGNALAEQLGKPFSGKEPDEYLLGIALFSDATVVAVPAGKMTHVFLEMAGKPPEYFAIFYLFEDNSHSSVFVKSSFAAISHEARALFLGKGSSVHFCALQQNDAKVEAVAGMAAMLGEAASLKFLNSNIGSQEKHDGFLFLQNERGSRCEHFEASLARGKQRFFKDSSHFHAAPDTYSRSIFKYATTDSSQVNVDGKVTIEQNAPGSDTHLLAKSLLLSENSISKVVPQLFVHNADVLAGHGSALTPMPEEELFYLQSRGVGESESKLLVLQGFLQELLSKSEIEPAALRELSNELERDSLLVFPRD